MYYTEAVSWAHGLDEQLLAVLHADFKCFTGGRGELHQ